MRRGILGLVCLLALVAGLTGTAQAASYDADTVIVKFADGVTGAERAVLFATTGVSGTVGSVAGVGADVVRVQGDPAVVAGRLDRSLLVSYAEPNFTLTASAVPNDPLFTELYGLNNVGQTGGRVDADCITWTHSGAKVISMSLGGGQSTTLQSAVAGAWENGAPTGSVLIAAAGNDGDSTVSYPAGYS